MTSLDISANPLLESVSCDWNELTTLDVSANPNLTYVSCEGNFIADTSALEGWQAAGVIEERELYCGEQRV